MKWRRDGQKMRETEGRREGGGVGGQLGCGRRCHPLVIDWIADTRWTASFLPLCCFDVGWVGGEREEGERNAETRAGKCCTSIPPSRHAFCRHLARPAVFTTDTRLRDTPLHFTAYFLFLISYTACLLPFFTLADRLPSFLLPFSTMRAMPLTGRLVLLTQTVTSYRER